jgi:signal transduction histidine kinase/CheY-like chemotaxis protein
VALDSRVEIGIVVSIAAILVLFSLVLSSMALRRNADADARGGMVWLVATNLAFLTGTGALALGGNLAFWLSAGLVILGAHLGILCGFCALSRALGRPPPVLPLAAVAVTAIAGQSALAAATGSVVPLVASSSAINGLLAAVLGWRLWPLARALGREHAMLAALPFAAISASYLARLPLLVFRPDGTALAVATVLITFLLAFSALQWCFALIAFRAARLNRRLQAERLRAEEASRLKSQFLANMSHEIRTPLNGVLGMAQVLHRQIPEPAQREMVETIQHSGETLLSILNDILDLSKIEAGRMELEVAAFRPADILERIARLYRLRAEERGLTLMLDLGPGLDAARMGDAHRIIQVLNNLLGNAIKFTERGSVRLTAAFLPGPDGPLRLVVEDTGIGMTPEQAARIFDEFVQADADITRRFGGTGLGMSIARRLVGLMGGTLALDSTPGRGTRVQLDLPLAPAPQADRAPTASGPAQPAVAAGALAGLRLLLAEDNRTNQRVVQAFLRDSGAELRIVENGRLAVAALAEAEAAGAPGFDLLMFDVSMPELDGPSALREIRARCAAAGHTAPPAIALTDVMAHQIADYRAAGFRDHLPKPLRRDALLAMIASVARPTSADPIVRRASGDAASAA